VTDAAISKAEARGLINELFEEEALVIGVFQFSVKW
jgi:hypothetical protein